MKKRMVSLLLVVCMVITLLPVNALASTAKNQAATAAQGQPALRAFIDVEKDSWYEQAVQYVCANGFFEGTSETTFQPGGTMTRAMFVTVLGRMAGVDAAKYAGDTGFTDVAEGTWYAPYVKWAAQHKITAGTGDGVFSPNQEITREQMAAFFVRYFDAFGVTPKTQQQITTTPADLQSVSQWARESVLKLWAMGLLNGDGVSFDPGAKATRAQTAVLCQRIDKAVETWYSEPGVPSQRVSVDPSEPQKPDTGKVPEDDPSDNGTTTKKTYLVEFAMGDNQPAVEMTLPENKEYEEGTPITQLPTPAKAGMIFLGWFYDKAMTRGVEIGDTVDKSMTLYAKAAAGSEVTSVETPNYVTRTEVAAGPFSFQVTGVSGEDEIRAAVQFINITDTNSAVDYTVNGSTVTAQLKAGQTYQVKLLSDNAQFVLTGDGQQPESVRCLNVLTAKPETTAARLNDDVKEIPASQTGNLADEVFQGIYQVDENGNTSQNTTTGTFTYSGSGTDPIQVGDILAVTDNGAKLDQVKADDGDVAYLKVTAVDGTKISYRMADVEDVLFMPDVLPIQSGWDTDSEENQITISQDNMTAAMTDVQADSVDAGDFLAFLPDGVTYSQEAEASAYGKIETVATNEETGDYVITYVPADEDEIANALDVYYTQERKITLTQEEQKQTENEIAAQIRNSGYAEEAAVYLAAVMLESDELNSVPDAEAVSRRMASMSRTSLANGIAAQDGGKKVQVEFDASKIKVALKLNQRLNHLSGNGFGVSVYVPFEVSVGSLKISVEAEFQEEVILRQHISTSRHKIGFLKYDYSLNASFEVGNYTGIKFNANVTTDDGGDDESMTAKLEEIMDQMQEYAEKPDLSATDGTMDSLAEIYQDVMENANDTWIDIVDAKLFETNGSAFLHIFCWQIKGSFVVSANLAVSIGMSFDYITQKQYNFSVRVKAKTSTNETVDIITPHYNFDFYVVGTIGIRAGLRLEMYVGLFSLKLDKIGITADVGAYAQLWGYFFYHLEWTQGAGKKSNSAGALYIEIGMYLDIKFVAQAFSSSKLTWNPTIYENQWPLWSAGSLKNIYDFNYDSDDPQLQKKIYTATTFALSASLFDMKTMDMKTGELSTENYDSTENAGGSEKNFIVTVSNPLFTYDPATNTVTVDRTAQEGEELNVEETCDITFIWKNSPLAFTSKPISRTVSILWSDMANARFISFDANGGSGSETVTKLIGQPVTAPAVTRQGYSFAGWYTDRWCSSGHEFTVPSVMGLVGADGRARGVVVYAKWVPRDDTPYTVNHYRQKLDGSYELVSTEVQTGTTGEMTAAATKSFEGFTPLFFWEQKIKADGSTSLDIRYARNYYTVKFSYGPEGGDTAPMSFQVRYGGTVNIPSLAMDGYDFMGYAGLAEDTGSVTVTEDATYTAQWQARGDTPYRVEHYTQRISGSGYLMTGQNPIEYRTGGTGTPIDVSELDWKQPGLVLDHATVNGSADAEPVITADGKTMIRLYYNRKDVTLTLNTKGGSFPDGTADSVTGKYGSRLSALPTPAKTGYGFGGWYTDEACTNEFTETLMPAEDTNLYAKWTAGQYTLSFDTDGGSDVASITQDYGTAITAPAEPTKEGYTFTGWEPAIPETMPAKDVTVKATWKINQYTITFDTDGGSDAASITQAYGTAITAPADPTKEGYGFAGWEPAIPETMPAENLTLTAKWTVGRYTLSFDTDGGSYVASRTMDYGADVTAPAEPTKEGYTFAGWEPEIPETMPAKDLTVKATWTVNQYTLKFVSDGKELASITQDYGTAITLPEDPTKEGYTFAGWDGQVPDTMPAEDKTFTAVWTIGKYTITFDTAGGSDISAITQEYGTAISKPANPTRTGYTFAGWSEEIPATMPAEDLTITANWTVNRYTIRFVVDGVEVASATQDYGTAITVPEDPIKEGYGFAGWDKPVPDTMPAEDMTFTATWAIGRYTLSFNTDGGSYVASRSLDYGAEVIAPAEPTKEGYTFAGWDPELPATMPANNLTVTAQWTINQYTITFNTDGGTAIDAITQDYGTAITAPAEPTKDGYLFTGWDPEIPATMPAKDVTVTAKWIVNTNVPYTVEFYQQDVTGDGYTLADKETRYGPTGTEVKLTSEDHVKYEHFEQHSFAPDRQYSGIVAADGSLTLRIYFNRKLYKVTYDAGRWGTMPDNSNSETQTVEYRYGQMLSDVAVTDPVQDGYFFDYWSYNYKKFTGPVEQDMTLTAEWKSKTVYYRRKHYIMDANGEWPTTPTETDTYACEIGRYDTVNVDELYRENLTLLMTIEYDHIEIDGKVATGEVTGEDLTDHDIRIYYRRLKVPLHWNFDGGEPVGDYTPEGEYYYESKITPPKTVVKEHYDFVGWTRKLNDDGTITMPNGAGYGMTVGAKWQNKTYSIKYDFAGGTRIYGKTYPKEYEYWTTYISIPEAVRDGYTFLGWQINGEGDPIKDLSPRTYLAGDATLTAVWKANSYTLRLSTTEGEILKEDSVTYGEPLPLYTPEAPTGYVFDGWRESPGGRVYTTESTMPASGLELHPYWLGIPYTVTYVTDCDKVIEPKTVRYNAESWTPDTIYRTGYTFAGWRVTSDAEGWTDVTLEKMTSFTMPNGDVTVTALWTPETSSIAYTESEWAERSGSYIKSSGTPAWSEDDSFSKSYVYGDTVTIPNPPERTGYTFEGWTVTYALVQKAEAGTNLTIAPGAAYYGCNLELEAKWKKCNYTVTVDLDNGKDPMSKSYEYEKWFYLDDVAKTWFPEYKAIGAPTKDNFTFIGWKVECPATGSEVTYDTTLGPYGDGRIQILEGDLNVTALWAAKEYTINLNTKGGTLDETAFPDSKMTFLYSDLDTPMTLPVPVRESYDFLGWGLTSLEEDPAYTEITLDTISMFFGSKTEITLYARWKKSTIRITSVDDLVKLSNSGESYNGTTILLMNDITLGSNWTSIGANTNTNSYAGVSFYGTFDGQGHTITLSGPNPLFGSLQHAATVKNLYVTFADTVTVTGDMAWGGITGFNIKGTIENCHVYGRNQTAETPDVVVTGGWGVGGIAGINFGSIKDCTVGVDPEGNEYPLYLQTSKVAYVGGFVGKADQYGPVTIELPESDNVVANVRLDVSENQDGSINRGVGGIVGCGWVDIAYNGVGFVKVKVAITAGENVARVGGILGSAITQATVFKNGGINLYRRFTGTESATNVGDVVGLTDNVDVSTGIYVYDLT